MNPYTVFVITPQYEGDSLYIAASSDQPGEPGDLYASDRYREIERGSLEEAGAAALVEAVALRVSKIHLI